MKIGKVSENVLKRSVLKQIKLKREEIQSGAGVGVDCAVFAFSGEEQVSVCAQAFPVDTLWDLEVGIQKAVNNLACTGAEAVALLLTILLPESTEEIQLKELMGKAQEISSSFGMDIAGGHTAVSPGILVPHVSISVLGKGPGEKRLLPGKAKPGQDIVISKWIGLEGSSRLARWGKEDLLTRYPAHLVETALSFERFISIVPEAAVAGKSNVSAMHDVSEGGIFRALWEVAESAGVGLSIDLKKLPIRQETVEVCEFFGISPYELSGAGSLIMIAEDGAGLVRALEEAKIPARVVGKITGSHDRVVVNEEEVRFLERPGTDAIHKILYRK